MGGAVRLTRVAAGRQASEHRARAMWVNMLLCARWKVTHVFSLLRTFCYLTDRKQSPPSMGASNTVLVIFGELARSSFAQTGSRSLAAEKSGFCGI